MAKGLVKKLSSGFLFWILFFVLIGSLFILNKNKITGVLEKTRANYLFFNTPAENGDNSDKAEADVIAQAPIQPITFDDTQQAGAGYETGDAAADSSRLYPDTPEDSAEKDTGFDSGDDTDRSPDSADSMLSSPDSTKSSGSEVPVRASTLYWISIDSDGSILRHAQTHLIPQSDSPLTDALTLLLRSPEGEKEKSGMLSLIPAGTQLRSVRVQDGIAFIDFSDEFQFNQYGIEGYLAQLAQIVFTATEFSTVHAVQFLIEGQKKEYLGSEGVWIGSPLSRSLF